MLIRREAGGDYDSINRVNRQAFDGDQEARLVELLRKESFIITSLVAVDDAGEVVGHVLFSPATIVIAADERQVASLAPLAVVPSRQRRGIGSRLVEHGLHECKLAGYRAAIVVGHPNYYPRFGFSHALVSTLENPFANGDAFMGVELARGSLSGLGQGRIVYPDVFNQL